MDDSQRRTLEQLFSQTAKPTVAQKEQIAKALQLSLPTIQTWFAERKALAKEEKMREEEQAKAALESAQLDLLSERASGNFARQAATTTSYQSQSQASYASLARSLKAAAACIPSSNMYHDMSMPPSPALDGFSSSYSPTSTNFDLCSSSMLRNNSQYSNNSTPAEYATDLSSYPWSNSPYMPTPQAAYTTMIYNQPIQEASPAMAVPVSRPRLSRNSTCNDMAPGRPVLRRAITSPFATASTNDQENTESSRIRRRPKLSPLGVGMARSRSCLGYDDSEPLSRRPNASSEFPYPLTPIRRIASSTTVPTLSSIYSRSPKSISSQHSPETIYTGFTGPDYGTLAALPLSPISPEHAGAQHQSTKGLSCFPSAQVATFTPPQTPLSVLNSSTENAMAGNSFTDSVFQMSDTDFMPMDMTLDDIFSEELMAMQSY